MLMRFRLATPDNIEDLVRMRWASSVEDRAELGQLAGEAYGVFAQACRSFLRKAVGDPKWAVWVVDLDGQIVSHNYVQLVEKIPRPGRAVSTYAYMTGVYTSPAHRSRGVGRRLLRQAYAWARRSGAEFVIVWPSSRAVAFYAREGFVPVREPMELPLR